MPKPKYFQLRDLLQGVYTDQDLSTTCLRQCGCCRVAMPQIKYSEASLILDKIWSEWSHEDKKKLLTTCLAYFFSKSLIKPCPLLNGSECRIYEDRPLSCRLYGLWPKEAWERRVAKFQSVLGLPKESIPLNEQCPFVKRKVKEPLTEEQIEGLYKWLDKIDKSIGGLADEQIEKNWNYRTLHDWVLYRFFGETFLKGITGVLLSGNDEAIAETLKILEEKVKDL